MERDLIQRAQAGDAAAFNELIAPHREALFRYAFLIAADAHAAEDITQEALLRIYTQLGRFDAQYAFRPWALAIVRNLARNQRRSWGRRKHLWQRLAQRQARTSPDVAAETQAQHDAQDLHAAVRQLGAAQQDVIYARYFLELSVDESADVLEVAAGTVKSRSHRALKQLRAIIERDYPHLREELSHAGEL